MTSEVLRQEIDQYSPDDDYQSDDRDSEMTPGQVDPDASFGELSCRL